MSLTSDVLHHYNDDHNEQSASIVVPHLVDLLSPKSVVDVGCGVAQWLSVFKQYGVERVVGLDGAHVPKDRRLVTDEEFRTVNLTDPISVENRFDLCISLEVAEHLEPEYACRFIDTLVSLSSTIVFSAAIPLQTGENHFNEQPPEYWEKLFNKRGYVVLDAFRRKFWNDARVNWWYRQNMYLVVRSDLAQRFQFPEGTHQAVHPELLQMHVRSLSIAEKKLQKYRAFERVLGGLKKVAKSARFRRKK